MFDDSLFRRTTCAVVLVTFTALTLRPLEALAQAPVRPAAPAAADTDDERYARSLNDVHELLKELAPAQAMPEAFRLRQELDKRKTERSVRAIGPDIRITVEEPIVTPKVDVAAKLQRLRGKFRELERLEASADRSFAAVERHLRDKNIPGEILARHQAAVAEYEARKAQFKRLASGVEAAAEKGEALAGPLAALGAFMARYPNQKTHTPTDPKNLPWRSPKPVERRPATTREEFRQLGLFGETVKVAQAGSLSGIALPTTTPPLTPTAEDLGETEDVQITQAIRDLATSLGNNPVRIYNWVRNNIEFIPSYGSIQGSDLTLQTKRGNSFDTASLLIALLRAASIPARYVYGTIEVPRDQVMNWVGGVTVPEAAQNLMGQGGIPNLGVASGGKITAIRLEHVWVEAFVDWVPSRGAVHRQGDTWVPMDGSFKQYADTAGMNVQQNVPFDAQGFLDAIRQGAEVNESEGWVRNVNQALIQQTLTNHQEQIKAYIDGQKMEATVGDVIGTQTIIPDNPTVLAGALPYRTMATGAKFATIPDGLRWKFRYNVYASDFDLANGTPVISVTKSTPKIGGEKITLSFLPATSEDEAVFASLAPGPNPDGTPIRVDQLPTTFPGYVIRLIPQVRLGGEVVASGPSTVMGQDLLQRSAVFDPSRGWEDGGSNSVIASEYWVSALSPQGIAPGRLALARDRLEVLRTQIAAQQFSSITREGAAGETLGALLIGYFAAKDRTAAVSGQLAGIVQSSGPEFGNVSTMARVTHVFGVPRTVGLAGVQLDIDRLTSLAVSKNGSVDNLIRYRRALGTEASALEHAIPERFFSTADAPADGVSAVKLIARGAALGQKIFTITRDTLQIALANIVTDSQTQAEIENAVLAGLEVTTHAAPVSVQGWTGTGYVIVDPGIGSGAYKISGAANGGAVTVALAALVAIAVIFFQIVAFVTLAPLWVSAFAFVGGLAITFLVGQYLTKLQKINVAAIRYIAAVVITLGFFAAGFVTLPGLAILGAAAMFVVAITNALLAQQVRARIFLVMRFVQAAP